MTEKHKKIGREVFSEIADKILDIAKKHGVEISVPKIYVGFDGCDEIIIFSKEINVNEESSNA